MHHRRTWVRLVIGTMALDRMIDIMQGNGKQWLRSGNRYRDFVAEAKYA